MKDICEHCKILNRCVKAYAVAGYPPCSQKSKESRPTVRRKPPVQHRYAKIAAEIDAVTETMRINGASAVSITTLRSWSRQLRQ